MEGKNEMPRMRRATAKTALFIIEKEQRVTTLN